MEKRITAFKSELKTRSEGDSKVLGGYFVVFGQETELYPGVFEEIQAGAVTDSLKNNDIRALFNHDTGKVLGRVGNQTLVLESDDYGLKGEIRINPSDQEANDIYSRVNRGDINEASFGFYVQDEEVIRDHEKDTTKFLVKKADVIEVSIVTWGAYPMTDIYARNRLNQIEDLKNRERKAAIKEFRKKYKED